MFLRNQFRPERSNSKVKRNLAFPCASLIHPSSVKQQGNSRTEHADAIGAARPLDRIKEIDLRSVPVTERATSIERIADMMAEKMISLCPPAAGFKCSRKRYRPFKEWQNISGIRLHVRRGLFSGYEIQLEPTDSECRGVAIAMCPSNLISDIRKYVSIAIGAAIFLISFWWLPVIEYWRGEFGQLTPLVMLALFLIALAVVTAVLQAPINLFRRLLTNKESEEAQKQEIKAGLQELAI